jgi:hypothetical protein
MPKLRVLELYQFFDPDFLPSTPFANGVKLIDGIDAPCVATINLVPMLVNLPLTCVIEGSWSAIDVGLARWGERHSPITLSVLVEEERKTNGRHVLIRVTEAVDAQVLFKQCHLSSSYIVV